MSQETIYQILKHAPVDWADDEDVWDTTYQIIDTLEANSRGLNKTGPTMSKTIIVGQTLPGAERIKRILNLPDAMIFLASSKSAGRGHVTDLLVIDAAISKDDYWKFAHTARTGTKIRVEVL